MNFTVKSCSVCHAVAIPDNDFCPEHFLEKKYIHTPSLNLEIDLNRKISNQELLTLTSEKEDADCDYYFNDFDEIVRVPKVNTSGMFYVWSNDNKKWYELKHYYNL
jgi:hypothetical protein